MNYLIRQATVLDAQSSWYLKPVDIRISQGIITEMGSALDLHASETEIASTALYVSQGWMDLQATGGYQGSEHREDLKSLESASLSGGFTDICLHSAFSPYVWHAAWVNGFVNSSKAYAVRMHPLGKIGTDTSGQFSEMADMYAHGAVAFSNYKTPITDSGLLHRIMQYAQNHDLPLFLFCNDSTLSHGGLMHEGPFSTILGLRGIPALAEELHVQQILKIAQELNARVHIQQISSAQSLVQIREAKASGLNVSCGVSAFHLVSTDADLTEFNTSLKVMPPLRSSNDRDALILGLLDGTIDVVVSDHAPLTSEEKTVEFDQAEFGMINLQTVFPQVVNAMQRHFKSYTEGLAAMIPALTTNPRKLIHIKAPLIQEQQPASLTLFDPTIQWTWTPDYNLSKSSNSPYFGTTFTGKVIGVFTKGHYWPQHTI